MEAVVLVEVVVEECVPGTIRGNILEVVEVQEEEEDSFRGRGSEETQHARNPLLSSPRR